MNIKRISIFLVLVLVSIATLTVFLPNGMAQDHTRSDDTTVRLLKTLTGHTDRIRSVCFSPDGKTIASGSNDDTIQLWDAITGKPSKTLIGHEGSVMSVCFSPDGKTIASGSGDKTVRLWDANTGNHLKTLTGHEGSVASVCFSPDSKTIASGSNDDTIRLWDATTGKLLKTLTGHEGSVASVCFSPNGKTIASGSGDKTVRLWDATTGKSLKALTGHIDRVDKVQSVCFSPDGKIIASGSFDNIVWLWDATTGKLLKTLIGHTDKVRSVCFSPDGKIIASGSSDETVQLWNATTGGDLQTLTGHMSSVVSVCFSPDGKTIASGSSDGTILMFGVDSEKILNLDARDTQSPKLKGDCNAPFGGIDSANDANALDRRLGRVLSVDLEKNTDGTWYVNSCELWLGVTLLPENMLPYTAEFKAPYPERYSISKGDWISVTVGKTLRNYFPDCTLYENFSKQDINCVIEPTNGVMSPERDNSLSIEILANGRQLQCIVVGVQYIENPDPEPDYDYDLVITRAVVKCGNGNLYGMNFREPAYYGFNNPVLRPGKSLFGEGSIVTLRINGHNPGGHQLYVAEYENTLLR